MLLVWWVAAAPYVHMALGCCVPHYALTYLCEINFNVQLYCITMASAARLILTFGLCGQLQGKLLSLLVPAVEDIGYMLISCIFLGTEKAIGSSTLDALLHHHKNLLITIFFILFSWRHLLREVPPGDCDGTSSLYQKVTHLPFCRRASRSRMNGRERPQDCVQICM